ncbi:MAG: nucleotide sugar dehydrogenase [Alphaproteobacteria bacterium]|nr:nucleotide sugar dehydrogenase [Alphaproteobacteria bacterium]
MITVGIAGLTHLGIVTAAGLADKGFKVLAWDPDPSRPRRLREGDTIVSEPGLADLLSRGQERLNFTQNIEDLASAGLIYIATDVPTDDKGESKLDGVSDIIDNVSGVLRQEAILTVLCQVPPGFTRSLAVPPGRLYYQVETLIFGRAVERTLSPERFIIGCANPDQPLAPALRSVLKTHDCPILTMRYESAELAKIAINCFLVSQVTTTNTLAEICEGVGAEWSEIAPALRLDRRIGPHAYLAPGLGISGGNLERDLTTVSELSRANDTESGVVDAWRGNSQWRKDWLYRTLKRTVLNETADPLITVLGLAYKENTDSVKNSPSIELLRQLRGRRLRVHDPVVNPDIVPWAEPCASAFEAARGADVLIVATPWPEYREISIADLTLAMKGRRIIDPFAILNSDGPTKHGFIWHRLGSGAAPIVPSAF